MLNWLLKKLVEKETSFDNYIGYTYIYSGYEVRVQTYYEVEQGEDIVTEVYVFNNIFKLIDSYEENREFNGSVSIQCL